MILITLNVGVLEMLKGKRKLSKNEKATKMSQLYKYTNQRHTIYKKMFTYSRLPLMIIILFHSRSLLCFYLLRNKFVLRVFTTH